MNKVIFVFALLLSGCAEMLREMEYAEARRRIEAEERKKQYISALKDRCSQMGFAYGSQANAQCVFNLDQANRQQQAANQAAADAAAWNYINSLNAQTNALNRQSRPITCTSHEAGIYTNYACQ